MVLSVSIYLPPSWHTPLIISEKASIDEAYMNLTPLIIERLIAKYPFLAEVPKDAPDGIDSLLPPAPPIDWADAGYVIPISDNDSDSGEPEEKLEHDFEHGEGDEDRGEGSSRTTCWSDWALRIGADIMTELREEIWKRLHYTTSAGVAHNKAMAKVSTLSTTTQGDFSECLPAMFVRQEAPRSDYTSALCCRWFPPRHTFHRCK